MSSRKHVTTRPPVQPKRPKKIVGSVRRKPASVNRQSPRSGEQSRRRTDMLAAFFRFSPDAVIVVDERGRITRVNDQVKVMFGYLSRELIGQRIEVLIPPRFSCRHVATRSNSIPP